MSTFNFGIGIGLGLDRHGPDYLDWYRLWQANNELEANVIPEGNWGTVKDDVIAVDEVDMRIKQNAKDHHTDEYELADCKHPIPILRRGQPFCMDIKFKRPFDFQNDRIQLEFSLGHERPPPRNSTYKILEISPKKEFTEGKEKWDVRLEEHSCDKMTIHINIPAIVSIGVWTLKIITRNSNSSEELVYEYKEKLHILFNPWCKEDEVYMEDDDQRQEYVLNKYGKIYRGKYKQESGITWDYAQFSLYALPACMMLLDRSKISPTARAKPNDVVRHILPEIRSSRNDEGVLVARWGDEYEGGTRPTAWVGSKAILKQFLESKGKPVKYGQCWVFAGVTTTVCRALGIPTRTVTGFRCAINNDKSLLTVDIFIDENGNKDKSQTQDSIWNFHVWNDCWMMRPDLPHGYGGWQAIDGTTNEGPASLTAIRRGEIGYGHDAFLFYNSINADIIRWKVMKTSGGRTERQAISRDTKKIGKKILVQKAGVHFRDRSVKDAENITGEYKYSEGTEEERMAMKKAACDLNIDIKQPEKQDVCFELQDIETVLIGQPFDVLLQVCNQSDEIRTIEAVISVNSVYYTGVYARKVKRETKKITLKPNQKETISVKVCPQEYMEKLVEHCNMKIYALATVSETDQVWSDEDDFIVDKPELKLQTKGSIKVGSAFDLEIEFTNPLDTALKGCFFTIDGPGLREQLTRKFRTIQPNETIVHVEKLIPRKVGQENISAVFNSKQLYEIRGSALVDVQQGGEMHMK